MSTFCWKPNDFTLFGECISHHVMQWNIQNLFRELHLYHWFKTSWCLSIFNFIFEFLKFCCEYAVTTFYLNASVHIAIRFILTYNAVPLSKKNPRTIRHIRFKYHSITKTLFCKSRFSSKSTLKIKFPPPDNLVLRNTRISASTVMPTLVLKNTVSALRVNIFEDLGLISSRTL